jgi:DNA-binding CsgD family transcriptional regulator
MNLTPYQLLLAKHMANGLTLKEISALTNRDVTTLSNHMRKAYRKNNCKNSTQFIYQLAKASLI